MLAGPSGSSQFRFCFSCLLLVFSTVFVPTPLFSGPVYTSCHFFLVRGDTAARFVLLSSPPCLPRLSSPSSAVAAVRCCSRWLGDQGWTAVLYWCYVAFLLIPRGLSLSLSLVGQVLAGGFHLVGLWFHLVRYMASSYVIRCLLLIQRPLLLLLLLFAVGHRALVARPIVVITITTTTATNLCSALFCTSSRPFSFPPTPPLHNCMSESCIDWRVEVRKFVGRFDLLLFFMFVVVVFY